MKYYTRIGDVEREYVFERQDGRLVARQGDRAFALDMALVGDGTAFSLLVDGRSHDLLVEPTASGCIVQVAGRRIEVQVQDERERIAGAVAGARGSAGQSVTAVMPGVVVELLVGVGDVVDEGATLLVLEAMKMQNPVTAQAPGRVTRVHAARGQAVAGGALLLELEALEDALEES